MEGDVESDLSVYHRVDDMDGMGSRRWAVLVPRLSAYAGAVQYRLRTMDAQPKDLPVQPAAAPGGGGVGPLAGPPSPLQNGTEVEATPAALRMSDIGDMFSFG